MGSALCLRDMGEIWVGNIRYLRGGRLTGDERWFTGHECSRRCRAGFVWFVGYGRYMGGKCVVFMGWTAYGGRPFIEVSRGSRVVFVGYGRSFSEASLGVGVVFAGCEGEYVVFVPRGDERSRRRRVVFAGYGRCMGGECVVFVGGRG